LSLALAPVAIFHEVFTYAIYGDGASTKVLARVGDEQADTRNIDEVTGSVWCTSDFDSSFNGGGGVSSSSVTSQARPRCCAMVRQ
jgi:hypothetical protein